jgi:GDP-mannose transporter
MVAMFGPKSPGGTLRRKESLPVIKPPYVPPCPPSNNSRQIVSGVAFCASSAAMILLNKAAMSTFHLQAPSCLVLFQCSLTPILVLLWCSAGFNDMPRLDRKSFIKWLPVNFMFSGMIWTSFLALRHIGVATCTVLKNLTNFIVILGDLYFFDKTYPATVWGTLFLMLISAICSGVTDLEYNLNGYLWQV